MSIFRFITRSLSYYWKQQLAVFVGTVVSTAVLAGAMILGDSVRYSLSRLVDMRLGKTQYSIVTGSRFIRAQLASDISAELRMPATSLMLLGGIAINPETGKRIAAAQVVGIDPGFSAFSLSKLPIVSPGEAIISRNTAQRLSLKIGDQFLVRVEKVGLIPVNAPFSPENTSSVAFRLTVAGIATDSMLGRFSLRNNQASPYNIFISRDMLGSQLQMKGLANVILIADDGLKVKREQALKAALKKCWNLQDASLRIDAPEGAGYFDLISSRIFIDDTVVGILSGIQLPHVNILSYLVNSFKDGHKQTPYSFATAASPPLVPESIGDNGIIINKWLADDLDAHIDDSMALDYFIIGPLRTLDTRSSRFLIQGIIPNDGSNEAKLLMPDFPGLSNAGSCRDWNTGIPVDLKRIRDKDEKYWKEFKGSPKAYISYKAGRTLWKNRFGSCTAIRFNTRDIAPDSLKTLLLKKLNPQDIGIELVAARQIGSTSAANSVDFGSLFLYLSFFVIAGSILLIILIYVLNTESRKRESAVFAGLGFSRKQITGLRLLESTPVIIAGGFTGSFAGIAYNYFLLAGLNSLWRDAIHTNMLKVKISPLTMVISAVLGIILALISIWWVSWRTLKNPVSGLLKDNSKSSYAGPSPRHILMAWIGISCIGVSIIVLTVSLSSHAYQNAGLFLTSGGLFLLGSVLSLAFLIARLDYDKKPMVNIQRLALKNARRNKIRSLSVILILALGVFIIILTGSYRRTFYGEENILKSGSGGYRFWAETSIPLSFNLNTANGKNKLVLDNIKDLDSLHFEQFHSFEGDDASCLNLNQVQKPRILGIPAKLFDKRQAFSFIQLRKEIDSQHPWKALETSYGNNIYPAFADQTVIQYGLKKTIGDTLSYLNERGKPFRLILAGGLDNSVFQGSLLVADDVLLNQFPSIPGSRTMLVDVPSAREKIVAGILSNSLQDYGIEITTVSARLSEFNSVENTYLAVFMLLGGLGLLMGTFGLGLILIRSMLERKHELALLSAMGFNRNALTKLIFTEYMSLLLAGTGIGIVSALIGILPSLLSPVFTVQSGFLIVIILLILLSGAIWIYVPARSFLRRNLVESLRNE